MVSLNWKEIVFRELNLLPFFIGSLILIILLKWLITVKSKRRASLGVSSLAFFERKRLFWRRLPEILFVSGIVLLIFALLNPVLPLVKNKKNIIAKEIMLVLDLSSSMTETWKGYWTGEGYVGPEDRSLLKIHIEIKYVAKFIEGRKDDALGLIVYSSNPYLTSPLNYQDHQSLISLIKLFGADVSPYDSPIPKEGSTATGDALFSANAYLKEYGQNKERIIVLFTDGESNRGRHPDDAFAEIQKTGFKVFILGIDYYKDSSAQKLAEQAALSGGGFFPIDTEDDLKQAVLAIDRLVGRNTVTVNEYVVDEPQYFYFGFIAFVLFAFVLLLKHLHYFRDLL